MTVIYPVIFTPTHDKKDTYLIEIPDLKSLSAGVSEGYGLKDAIRMARDYIGGCLYKKEDSSIPVASEIGNVDLSKSEFVDIGGSFVSMVDLDLDAYRHRMNKKAVRKNVSIPEWLDEAAKKANINVSRVLQDALMEKLGVSL